MQIRSNSLLVLISIMAAIIGGLSGAVIGSFLYMYYIPPWKHYEIDSLQGAKNIILIEIQSTLDDPTEDTLYVLTETGEIFSNTLFQHNWQQVSTVPENKFKFSLCAEEWSDHPPAKKELLDSAGVRFERPLSTSLRCYVLLNDGSLQVWTRSTDVFSLMKLISVSAIIGAVAGIIIGFMIRRKVRNPVKPI